MLEARQPASHLGGGVQEGDEHRREVGQVGDPVPVDEPDGLIGVVARHQDGGAARVHDGERPAERGDVEQRQGHQVAVLGAAAHRGHDGQVRGEHVAVGEGGAAWDRVDGRGGDHREHVVRRDGRGRRRGAAVESAERPEAGGGVPEPVPVLHLALLLRPAVHDGRRGRVDHHHPGARPLEDLPDLLRGEPPVDGVRDDPLARAGPVQLEVLDVVLGQHADAIPRPDAEPGEPAGERVHALAEPAEGQHAAVVDDGGGVAVDVGAPRDHVVDREAVDVHHRASGPPPTGRRCRPSSARGRQGAPASPSRPPCACPAPSPAPRRWRSTRPR